MYMARRRGGGSYVCIARNRNWAYSPGTLSPTIQLLPKGDYSKADCVPNGEGYTIAGRLLLGKGE